MFDFHESLMRPSVLFSRDWAQMQLFSCRSWHTRFPLELEVPRLSPLSWLNSIGLNARYAAEDAIKKSRRKLKVGGWSKFNLILPVKASRQIKGTVRCIADDSESLSPPIIIMWDSTMRSCSEMRNLTIDRKFISILSRKRKDMPNIFKRLFNDLFNDTHWNKTSFWKGLISSAMRFNFLR